MVPVQALFQLGCLQVLLHTKFKCFSRGFRRMINSWDGEVEETLDHGQTLDKQSMEKPNNELGLGAPLSLTLCAKLRSLVLWRGA